MKSDLEGWMGGLGWHLAGRVVGGRGMGGALWSEGPLIVLEMGMFESIRLYVCMCMCLGLGN